MKISTKWMFGLTSSLLVLGGIGWTTFGGSAREDLVYTVEKASRRDLKSIVNATGEIQAKTKMDVGTTATAVIKSIHVKNGQWVNAGDLLITLDQEQFVQELAQHQLGLQDATQALRNAESAHKKQIEYFQRRQGLFKEDCVSEEEYQTQRLNLENTRTTVGRAKVAVEQAMARVAVAQDRLSKTTIRASMSGQVTSLSAEKGETAIAGVNTAGSVLMVISDMSEIIAEVKVGELDVVKLKAGSPAEVQVDAVADRIFQGQVLDVAPSVEKGNQGYAQDAHSYRVRIQLKGEKDDLALLKPGLSARVAILNQVAMKAITVPLQAIQERKAKTGGLGLMNATKTIVFAIKDGKVEERTIKTGVMDRRAIEVIEGVGEGEDVIIGPPKAMAVLASGASVKTQTEAEAIKRRRK